MSHFSDLSAYTYKATGTSPKTLNVGWLDPSTNFPTGVSPADLVDKLWELCCSPVVMTRGFHVCPFCKERNARPYQVTRGKRTIKLGSAEIRVFGQDNVKFAAPDLIFHYVAEHFYLPPDEIVEAVLFGPAPGSEIYKHALEKLNIS